MIHDNGIDGKLWCLPDTPIKTSPPLFMLHLEGFVQFEPRRTNAISLDIFDNP